MVRLPHKNAPFWLFLLSFAFLFGCGYKTKPVAIQKLPPSLSFSVLDSHYQGSKFIVRWQDVPGNDGYILKHQLLTKNCQTCPFPTEILAKFTSDAKIISQIQPIPWKKLTLTKELGVITLEIEELDYKNLNQIFLGLETKNPNGMVVSAFTLLDSFLPAELPAPEVVISSLAKKEKTYTFSIAWKDWHSSPFRFFYPSSTKATPMLVLYKQKADQFPFFVIESFYERAVFPLDQPKFYARFADPFGNYSEIAEVKR